MATLTCGVAVSIPRISTGRPLSVGLGPSLQHRRHGAHAGRPARADRGQLEVAVVVGLAESQPHLEVVGRQRRDDGVTPFDERDPALVEHLGQAEVVHLGELLEAVHVEVVHRRRPSYCDTSVNVGLVIGLDDAERRAEALGERGLAGPEVAGEQDQVARAGELGERGRHRLGVVDRLGHGRGSREHHTLLGEHLFGSHQIGPHLRHRLAAAPQHVRGVHRGYEHPVAEGIARTAQLGDARLGLEQQLRGELAERHDHLRVDEIELLLEPGIAGADLVRLRITVVRAGGT